jgi:hypothetical protein
MFENVEKDSVEWDVLCSACESLEWQVDGLYYAYDPDGDEFEIREDTIHTIVTGMDTILSGLYNRLWYTWDWNEMTDTEKAYRLDELNGMADHLTNSVEYERENYDWLSEEELSEREIVYMELVRMIRGIMADAEIRS